MRRRLIGLETTVPTQALFFLNDPFVHRAATRWARTLIATTAEPKDQIHRAMMLAFSRSPEPEELDGAAEFLNTYAKELHGDTATFDGRDEVVLAAFLRTLIGSNEFLHVD